LTDPQAAAEQALQMVKEHRITTVTGKKIEMKVDTLCIHGDTPGAAKIARAIRERLEAAKISIESLHQIVS
jgi:UPF0271 protein